MEKTQTTPMIKRFKTTTTQNQPSNTKNWADLPKDVLYIIAYNLDFKTDITRLRGVCPSWRSALPLADFPLRETHYEVPPLDNYYYYNNNKALVPTIEYTNNTNNKNKPLFLVKTRYYLFYPLPNDPSNRGWIARMGELGLNKWRLLSPLHNVAAVVVNEQRYMYTDPQIIGEINLLDHRVVELARPISLVYDLNYNAQPISRKVVEGARAVLVLLGSVLMLGRLGDPHWFRFELEDHENDDWKFYYCKDIEFHNGKFYAFWTYMIYQFQVWVINPGDLSIMKQVIDVPSILQVNEGRRYGCTDASFVSSKSNGCLYLVIDVYRYEIVLLLREEKNEMMNKWERVKNMENMTFFIGGNVSFALPPPPTNLGLWIPNSIYSFNTSMMTMYLTKHSNVGVVSWDPRYMMKGLEYFQLVRYPSYIDYFTLFIMDEDYNKDAHKVSMDKRRRELCTRLFFPPPSWVKWRCPSRDNVEISLDQFIYD